MIYGMNIKAWLKFMRRWPKNDLAWYLLGYGLAQRGGNIRRSIRLPAVDSREAFELLEDYEDWS